MNPQNKNKSNHIGDKTSAHKRPKQSPLGHLMRFIGMWFGFSGLYAAFSVCPFCGNAGCPVGTVTAGTLGGFFALFLQDWNKLIAYIKLKLKKNNSK